jgi:serpin B
LAPAARLTNVSIRARAGSGANTLIAGATLQGSGAMPMLVRAIGPGLAQFGVAGALRDPQLEVFRGGTLAAQTNTSGQGVTAASAYVGAFPPLERTATAAGDAVLVGQAPAGTLTAHCSSPSGAPGVALLEFYDATAAPGAGAARFVNLSSRAPVEGGEGLIVIGFVVAGPGNVTLLLRGAGVTLEQFGVTGVLRDPTIELYSGSVRIAANDNWRSGDAAEIARLEEARLAVGAFALTSASDAAMLVSVPAGAYTLQVRGAAGQSGIALGEIHEVGGAEFNAAQSTNVVGLELYRELARNRAGENLIVSPYSIESALALAYAGADGATREEMARVLRLPAGDTALQVGFAALRRALEDAAANARRLAEARTRAGQPTDPIEWNAANRLFGQRDYAFRDAFLTLMRDGFAAPFEPLDFRLSPEPSRLGINAWVEEQTRQRIRDLIPMGAINRDTRLVLVNALYLKAPWDTPFVAANTAPRAFRLVSGASRNVPTMQRTGQLGYAAEDGFTIVTLDYLGNELQFVIALPDEGQSVEAAAARLTSAHFTRWAGLGTGSRRNIALQLPKFTVRGSTVPLGQALRALGMRTAFDEPPGSANFDRIAPRRPDDYLAISDVFHQTFVALDEQGTEAAAATAVVMVTVTAQPPPPLEVRVDRPFFFAIQHRASGTCLFFGRVMDPQ